MCGPEPCLPLYASNAVRGAALDAQTRRCSSEVTPRGAVAVEVLERPGCVRIEARLLSGAGIVLELTPIAARSIASCLDRAADKVDEASDSVESSTKTAIRAAR